MEPKNESRRINNSFLGKKMKIKHKSEELNKSDELDNSKATLFESTFEFSSDNILPLEEKSIVNAKIPGFDDLIIPEFFNDSKTKVDINKKFEDYTKMKMEFGSAELAELYLIDVNKLYLKKRKNVCN